MGSSSCLHGRNSVRPSLLALLVLHRRAGETRDLGGLGCAAALGRQACPPPLRRPVFPMSALRSLSPGCGCLLAPRCAARQRLLLQNREQCGGYLRLPACFAPLCSDECVARPELAAAAAGLTSLPPSTAAPQRRFCMQARPVAQRRPAASVAAEQRAVVRLHGGQHQRQGTSSRTR